MKVNDEEIFEAVKQISRFKVPGSYGMQVFFYHKFKYYREVCP